MRRLIVLSLLATLALAAPASAQLTHIRPGMTAGGVDLSGLAVPDAAAKLDAELAPRLAPDLLIGVAGRPWVLKMADAKLKFDSTRTAKRALYAKAGVLAVAPAISHSHAAVAARGCRTAAGIRLTNSATGVAAKPNSFDPFAAERRDGPQRSAFPS